jgi:hypothetical protein
MARSVAWRPSAFALAGVVWTIAIAAASLEGRVSNENRAVPVSPRSAPAEAGAQDPKIAAEACGVCHAATHRRWSNARHSKMLQPATASSVLAPFDAAPIQLRGAAFTLIRDSQGYAVRGPFPTSAVETHRVIYTLGSRRVQHYLTRLSDGRLVVLPPTWDVERREWFHNLDIVNPDDAAVNPIQVWNRSCLGCHVSGEERRFDAAAARYDTRWTDFGTSCERCHGPGADHVARMRMDAAGRPAGAAIVVPTRLDRERSTMVCAQCHSLRDITVPGFAAGDDYYDHFTPILEYAQPGGLDPPYWADGRPRRFSNDAIGLWQSRCWLDGGATCTTCHVDPHEPDIDRNPQLSSAGEATCAKCHADIVRDVPAHSRHAPGSAGTSCVGCHMPRTVVSLRSSMPDHTIGVPAPENTVRHGIPNACTECHRDRGAEWAVRTLAEWFPGGRRQRLVARANAFAAARRGETAALDGLIAIVADRGQPPLVRANAAGHLRRFPGPRAESYLLAAASDEHPAVRLTAVLGLGEPGFTAASATPVLVRGLADPRRVVRVGAAVSLVNRQVTSLEGAAGPLFEQAKRDYLTRAILLADDAGVRLDAGKFQLLNKDVDAAAASLEAALGLDAGLHAARYFLAIARLAQGRAAEARELLAAIPPEAPQAPAAARILAALPPGRPPRFR